ncbi:PREDICTED: quinone oxidoreductase PIG3 [Calidris pugnax]|uniref:quinone oxidoreductase PIG3 n=1 Tax=Calidris pugnax TaxID=198806 RepID=UPI00071E5C59|nr:PREDICTED: quinone oxidoreductase PIG3 [Calidris pugnax]
MNRLQALLNDSLIGTKHVENAAIIHIKERKVSASTFGFNVSPEDALSLISTFSKNLLQVRKEGLYFNDKYYKCVRADEHSLYLQNPDGGLIVVKTKIFILVATYSVGMYPSVCVEAVEKLENMLAVYFDCPGGPENLYVKEVMKPQPGEGEVLVKVSASALNRADLLQRSGKYPPPKGASDILGLEAAGSVAGLGPGCRGRWKVGDAVMALLSGGGQAEYVTVPEGYLMPLPRDMTFIQAAAIPEAWLTAFQLLHFVGKIQKGERVLIHAGASGVGLAAIQLVRLAQAVPIVTAGTPEKLKAAANAGAAVGVNYKNEDFSEKVLEFTQGAGVDIILDCVGGSYWEKNLNCLSTDGRWIIYGLLGGGEVRGDLFARLLSKRGSIHTSLLRSRDKEYKERLVKAFTEDVLPYFSGGTSAHLRPLVDSVYSLHEIAEAHRFMEENKNIGKIVIEMPASS